MEINVKLRLVVTNRNVIRGTHFISLVYMLSFLKQAVDTKAFANYSPVFAFYMTEIVHKNTQGLWRSTYHCMTELEVCSLPLGSEVPVRERSPGHPGSRDREGSHTNLTPFIFGDPQEPSAK